MSFCSHQQQRQAACLGVNVGYLLDCTPFTRSAVLGRHNATVSALTKLLNELIFRIDNESRIEGREAVSLHCQVSRGLLSVNTMSQLGYLSISVAERPARMVTVLVDVVGESNGGS